MNQSTMCATAPRSLALGLLAAWLLAGCAGQAVENHEAAPRPEPIEYVAPELRGDLRSMTERYAAMDFRGFDADTLEEARAGMARYEAEFLPAPAVEERSIPGAPGDPDVTVYVIGRRPGDARPAILHMHGGGFILGTARAAVPRLQQLAVKHDCVVVTVDYRLAPETPFPGPRDDNYAALRWLHDNATDLGVDPTVIAVMGDSAGGGHAAMLALHARDRGGPPVAHQFLVYPMLDDRTASTRDMPYWMGYGAWTPQANRFGWSSLLGVPAGSADVPEGAVPARAATLAGLPPTFIAVGSVDLFVQENIEYAQRLILAGVPTELVVLPGAYHGFQATSPDTLLARRFNAAIDAAIARAFAQPAAIDE